jgi:hypothetical protein
LRRWKEEEPIDKLPAEVKAGLSTKVGGARFTKVESITKKGQLVVYEAHLRRGGKKSEVQVGRSGQALDDEE